jgi:hypothetical protein
MSSSKSKFYSLSPVHQRALHELWLARTDKTNTFVVSEETKLFLLNNQDIVKEEFNLEFERHPFELGEYSQVTVKNKSYLVYNDPPQTPPYQPSDSEEEDASTVKISRSKSSSSSFINYSTEDGSETPLNFHKERTGATHLNTSPRNSHTSQIMSNDDHEEGEYVEDNTHPPDEPEIQFGLSGQPLESSEKESNIFMSNQKKIRIDSAYPITHELIKKFVSQVRNEDFKSPIEKLIDHASWRQILRTAKGRCQDINSATHSARLLELLSLERFMF